MSGMLSYYRRSAKIATERVPCKAVKQMEVGPPASAAKSRCQMVPSCWSKEPR